MNPKFWLICVSFSLAHFPTVKEEINEIYPYYSNYGIVTRVDDTISIIGHQAWWGCGIIRPDRKVQVHWFNNFNIEFGVSIYTVKGREMKGVYGSYNRGAFLNEKGDINGDVQEDCIKEFKR